MIPRPDWCGPDEPYMRLSYSTLEAMNTCERKYQLDKILINGAPREESEHFSFGHGFGAGVASYMVYGDMDSALLDCWMEYWPICESEKKTEESCMMVLMRCQDSMDELRDEWEVAEINGEPAVELSFRINIDSVYYFVGYIDVVLRHKLSGRLAVLEVKSTGLALLDLKPVYKNSGQALGYSIVLDAVAGEEQAEYTVTYIVGQLGRDVWGESTKCVILPFKKNVLDRLNWFMSLSLDVAHLHEMAELQVYPKRGSSCLHYMKPCPHFGVCGLHGADRVRTLVERDDIEYQFVYNLDDLIEDHIRRIA